MSGPFDEKFTDEQRDACGIAYCNGATAKQVVQTAADGLLQHRGKALAPFDIKASYVATLGQRERRRRQGRAVSKVAELPHRDALENMRRRSVSAADTLLAAYEKALERKPENADPERLRQIIRVQLEASRLPGPTDARTPSSGTRDESGKQASRTTGGIAGALLADHRQGRTAQESTPHTTDSGDNGAAQHDQPRLNERSDGRPGALPSEQEHRAEGLPVVV